MIWHYKTNFHIRTACFQGLALLFFTKLQNFTLFLTNLGIEVEEALNVIENWHSGNHFIFFGKRGVVSSNNPVDQELSILALHLLQSSLVYINTLMIQQVLKKPIWSNKLTIEDKRALTPLFYNHINQYGLYSLDMNKRINIEGL